MTPSIYQNSTKIASVADPNAITTTAANPAGISGGTSHNMFATSGAITQKSNCGSSLSGSMTSYKMSCSENSWTQQTVFSKENQRPPVYNPEDYVLSLKKFAKRQRGQNVRSIYDTSETITAAGRQIDEENSKSSTLPTKHTEYKSPITAPPENVNEMSLRQFASITDLLTKLRADLRVSVPSFVQEFVATPSDGVSLLLDVLRAIQLSQAINSPLSATQMSASMPRNSQSNPRRALLDELACLQCLSLCCSRSMEATSRLGNTPIGLMPLASSATGQGIRARILALQLMTAACDKHSLGHGSKKITAAGHTAVSEAMSTLRLRCSEPVRFRLLIGMLNSGGGSGELQAVGVKFINTFLESAENLQQRLYLQAELFQAGFEPSNLVKTISSSSPWLDTLRNELKRFNELYVDVDKMIIQAREADRVRSQMVILERRVQILHEEKAVLTSMERRLQERCAELQREIFRLQGAQNEQNSFKSLDKQPIALPRHVPPTHDKQDSSEHEDEGISSSETGPSLSPVPILILPQKSNGNNKTSNPQRRSKSKSERDEDATIEHALEELDNIVSEAEKQICTNDSSYTTTTLLKDAQEKEIVPVNILPQPPRKSRSLAHLVSQPDGSELDGSDYGMLLIQNHGEPMPVERVNPLQTFFDETDFQMQDRDKSYALESADDIPDVHANTTAYNSSTTRELLDVIMNARHTDDDPTIKAFCEGNATNGTTHKRNSHGNGNGEAINKSHAPLQQFNGVFFMTDMKTPQKYPKPDLTAAIQAKRVTKNVERLEAAFATNHNDHSAVIREKSRSNQQIYFGSHPSLRPNISSYTNNGSTNNVNSKANNNNITARTHSCTQVTKVTDTLSGLY